MVMPSAIVLVVVSGFLFPPVGSFPAAPPAAFVAPPAAPMLAALGQETPVPRIGLLSAVPALGVGLSEAANLIEEMMEGRGPDRAGARASIAFALVHGRPGRSSYDVYLNIIRDRSERLRQARRVLDG